MSLTFEFPQWRLRVTSGLEEGYPDENREDDARDAETDWTADLAELDGDDDMGGTANGGGAGDAERRPPGTSPRHDNERLCAAAGAAPASNPSAPDPPGEVQRLGVSTAGLGPGGGGGDGHGKGTPVGPANGGALPSGCGLAPVPSTSGGVAAGSVDVRPAAAAAASSGTSGAASGPRPAPAAISGDAIPAEVLLLVLSGLRDVGDCVRAALVCRHWLSVVTLSNELWFELYGIHLAGGAWHRPPHAGRPLLRPPPGCDHPHSKMLSYKTTCALTQAAVRFMALRKGFEYVVEAAASLWLAAQRAATQAAGQQQQQQAEHLAQPPHEECQSSQRSDPAATSQRSASVRDDRGNADGRFTGEAQGGGRDPCSGSDGNDGGGGGAGAGASGGGGGGRRRRITHVDQLWESCGRSRTALQVDERFNAVRVQQMVSKLCSSSGATWLPLYEGLAAVMASRCDQLRDEMAAAAAATRDAAVATAVAAVPLALMAAPLPSDLGPKRLRGAALNGGGAATGSVAASFRSPQQPVFRGEVVYGGSSYADQFAELLRRGDTRGALALAGSSVRGPAAAEGATAAGPGVGDGADTPASGGGVHWELDEPEMREVLMVMDDPDEQGRAGGSAGGTGGGGGSGCGSQPPALPPVVSEGVLLWRRLLSGWAVYRRWLEVLAVWCGPLGARVEAERQLAGGAAAHGKAPLAPPHLANKGLLLFRSQVLLAYPLRRPLQAAALWLSARAARGDDDGGGGGLGGGGGRVAVGGGGGGSGGAFCDGPGPGLSEEHTQLLTGIRKLLTELAVPDDATQPPHLHSRQKLQRCFGGLLRRPATGGARALQQAQRLHGLRAAAAAAGAGGGAC